MKRPPLASRIYYVEHLLALEIDPFDLVLKGAWRTRRNQLIAHRAENRKSGPPERVLDLAVGLQSRFMLHVIAAELLSEAFRPRRCWPPIPNSFRRLCKTIC